MAVVTAHLKTWRLHRGLTLAPVAKVLGTSHFTILRYEQGRYIPSDEALVRLSALYGCKPCEMMFPPDQRHRGRRQHEAIDLLTAMSDADAERWLAFGRNLIINMPIHGE